MEDAKTNLVEITYHFKSAAETGAFCSYMHEQLRGLSDYVNSSIVLHVDSDNNDVNIIIGDECSLEGKIAILGWQPVRLLQRPINEKS